MDNNSSSSSSSSSLEKLYFCLRVCMPIITITDTITDILYLAVMWNIQYDWKNYLFIDSLVLTFILTCIVTRFCSNDSQGLCPKMSLSQGALWTILNWTQLTEIYRNFLNTKPFETAPLKDLREMYFIKTSQFIMPFVRIIFENIPIGIVYITRLNFSNLNNFGEMLLSFEPLFYVTVAFTLMSIASHVILWFCYYRKLEKIPLVGRDEVYNREWEKKVSNYCEEQMVEECEQKDEHSEREWVKKKIISQDIEMVEIGEKDNRGINNLLKEYEHY